MIWEAAAAGAILLSLWHVIFVRYNRRHARQTIDWLESAVGRHGGIVELHWTAPDSLHIDLKVSSTLFKRAVVKVQLHSRHLPLAWLRSWWNRQPETLTFEADLHYPPAFSLEVHNRRWYRPMSHAGALERCDEFATMGPFVITTRTDWQREIVSLITTLLASRDCGFRRVNFRRSSPHFTATVPLHVISSFSQSATELFEVVRDLASCGSASRF